MLNVDKYKVMQQVELNANSIINRKNGNTIYFPINEPSY